MVLVLMLRAESYTTGVVPGHQEGKGHSMQVGNEEIATEQHREAKFTPPRMRTQEAFLACETRPGWITMHVPIPLGLGLSQEQTMDCGS